LMSLQPRPWPEPAEEIVTAVRKMYAGRRAPLPVVIRDELGELFADERFAVAFADRGTPGWSPGRLALVTGLQMVENLTDRQAAEAVRDKLSWKYALGLELTDTGFDFSVLSEFRARVARHGLEAVALDLLVAALVDKGLIKPRGKQRTDSTHVLAAVRDLNRLELAGEAVRAALEALVAAAAEWVPEALDVPGWAERYGLRVDSWRLPASKTKRAQLAVAFGRDGFTLLGAVYAPDSPPWLAQLPAVAALRQILVQNYVIMVDRQGREVITARDTDTHGLPPGRCRISSPYDLHARWGGKRDLAWNGYKLHISETCDAEPTAPTADDDGVLAEPPNLITNVATTDASVPDVAMTEPIHAELARRGVLPAEHYLDSGYPSADLLVSSQSDYDIRLVTPMLADTSAQARAGDGYDRTAFTVDWHNQQATCPQGQRSHWWNPTVQRGSDVIVVKFAGQACQPCPVKTQCTSARRGGRQLTLRPRAVQETLDAARAEQATTAWQARYARRAGAESTIAQSVKVTDTRQARYRGLPKTRLEHNFKAIALNFIRLDAWFNGIPIDPRHTSHLTRLDLTLAA
jgi:transposase